MCECIHLLVYTVIESRKSNKASHTFIISSEKKNAPNDQGKKQAVHIKQVADDFIFNLLNNKQT